jgi:hypothetical protein
MDAVSEDVGRRGETSGTPAADVCESAAVADGLSATDREVRDRRWEGADVVCVVSAVVLERAAVRGELSGDGREERAVIDEPLARVRLDADGGRAVVSVGCGPTADACARAAVLEIGSRTG